MSALTSSDGLWLLDYIGLGLRGRRQCRGREGFVSLRVLRLPEYILRVWLCFLGEQDGGIGDSCDWGRFSPACEMELHGLLHFLAVIGFGELWLP